MQILLVDSTTGLLSGLLAHWARKVLYSLAKQKLSLALGVGLADFLSPVGKGDFFSMQQIKRRIGKGIENP